MDSYWFDNLSSAAQHAVLDAVRATRGEGTAAQVQRARTLDHDYGDPARRAYWEQIPFRNEALGPVSQLGHGAVARDRLMAERFHYDDWLTGLPDWGRKRLPRLTPWRALRRTLCPHRSTGGAMSDDLCVHWCLDCGHTEIALAPLAPDPEWFPEGKPAWDSAGDL